MTAQASERARDFERINKWDVTFTGSKVWKGASVGLVLAGASAGKFAEMGQYPYMRRYGVCFRTVDASAADALGTVQLDYEVFAEWFPQQASVIVAADFGKAVAQLDDQTVALGTEAVTGVYPMGRIWDVNTNRGVLVELLRPGQALPRTPMALAFTANDYAPAGIVDGGVYDIGTTAAASTISLPASPPDGISATFIGDGTKNGHTVTMRDVATAISAAYTASKRLHITVTSLGGKWFAAGVVGP